jgi:ribonuclease P/MRP protein subunit POP1
MVEDNTPTVTSRRRIPNSHQRLRLETAQRLQKLSSKSKERRQEKKAQRDAAEVKVSVTAGKATELATSETPTIAGAAGVTARKPRVKTGTLKSPAVPPAKFRKRQIHKTWLPTHLFHSKRAHMTPPKEPLWRFALPLTPTNKSYRTIHRATTQRGAVAWDTSYMSTIGLEGPEKSIEGLFRALGVGAGGDTDGILGKSGAKWRNGTRVWEGWLHERQTWPVSGIAPATVIWNAKSIVDEEDAPMQNAGTTAPLQRKEKRKVFIRMHPAGFMQLWDQIVRLAKVQKPLITVEDLRFEIGSIEISGPNATEALVGVLRPVLPLNHTSVAGEDVEAIWPKLAFRTASSLPNNAIMSFEASDPRLYHPPRTVTVDEDNDNVEQILQLLASWPLDKSPKPAAVFKRNSRLKAGRSLSSQKSINRRKSLALPGTYPNSRPEDPQIPVLVFASRSNTNSSGTWTVLLPWKCVLPFWTSIMYYPLSTGGKVRLGGVEQKRQTAFESGTPWFPGDFPGTKAGDAWEAQEQEKRKADWEKKPKGRRTEYESVDLGMGRKGEVGVGWACDWQILLPKPKEPDGRSIVLSYLCASLMFPGSQNKYIFQNIPNALSSRILNGRTDLQMPPNPLATVKLTVVTRGVPQTCARIYRLPSKDEALRKKWLDQLPSSASKKARAEKTPFPQRPGPDALPALQQAYLAATILATPPTQPGNADYPFVPDEEDLIGFVTTGNFNLGEGKGIGIGALLLTKVETGLDTVSEAFSQIATTRPRGKEERLCIIRDVGQSVGRLARWELV